MPTVIRVPMLITFLTNSHAYGNLGAYTYSEGKSTYVTDKQMDRETGKLKYTHYVL